MNHRAFYEKLVECDVMPRTSQATPAAFAQVFEEITRPVLLGYTGLSDALLQKYMEDSSQLWQNGVEKLRYTPIGSVIGTHAGPGAVAVAFFHQ